MEIIYFLTLKSISPRKSITRRRSFGRTWKDYVWGSQIPAALTALGRLLPILLAYFYGKARSTTQGTVCQRRKISRVEGKRRKKKKHRKEKGRPLIFLCGMARGLTENIHIEHMFSS